MEKLEDILSSEQWDEIIKAAKWYCVQCPLEYLQLLLPASVYQHLPSLLAHAIINKDLWRIIENPFYYIDPKYNDDNQPLPHRLLRPPPEDFGSYLHELFQEMTTSRREDTLKCRQLMVRTLNANGLWSTGGGYLTMDMARKRDNATVHLVDTILNDSSPLRRLFKHDLVSEEQRKELLDLYALAGEFSVLCGVTTKGIQVRMWDELPLYTSNNRLMELNATSNAARKDSDVDRTTESRLVVLMTRPSFSYLLGELKDGELAPEHVVSKAIVVVAKKETPVKLETPKTDSTERPANTAKLFGNFKPEIAAKLQEYFSSQYSEYDADGWHGVSWVKPLGCPTSILSKKGAVRQY
ncbi:hypothetical protein BDV18DRAFT_137523 [Aspergillus unguis]